MNYFLGLDCGGTGTKAAVYSERGEELSVAGTVTETLHPISGYAERDMEELWRRSCSVIRRAVQAAGISPRQITCVACCGHGKGLYLWGEDNRPAYPGIGSTDRRAWEYPLRWAEDGTGERVFSRTLQRILPSQPVSLLAWFRDNRPEVLARTRYVFSCKDYLRFRLTGAAYAERTDASGSNLVNLRTGGYDHELLSLFGLREYAALLPPLRDSTELCAAVTERAAAETGLAAGTPVAGGAFDIDACAVAVNAFSEDTLCMIAGTWSINEYVSSAPALGGESLMNSLFCLPGKYLVEECSPTSAGNLEWFVDALLPELKTSCAQSGASLYDVLNRWVEELPPETLCPIFLPFLMGSNAHPNAKAALIGLDCAHGRNHIVRSVYEGVAFSHRYHLEKLLRARKEPPRVIRLAGGAKNSPVWTQMFADVMRLPVEVADANETGTLGCAVLAATAAGVYGSLAEAADRMCRSSKRMEPNPGCCAVYERKYRLYHSAITLLDPLWNQMKAFSTGED